jgi:hypothetical protein
MATAFTVIKNAIKHNLKLIGAGRYSAVFQLNDYEVLKIGSDLKDPFLDYINILSEYPSNHFLKVNSIYKADNYYIANIEKLSPSGKVDLDHLSIPISILTDNLKKNLN